MAVQACGVLGQPAPIVDDAQNNAVDPGVKRDLNPRGFCMSCHVGQALLGNAARLICFDDHHRYGVKDITEWFESGRSETEFVSLLEFDCRSK